MKIYTEVNYTWDDEKNELVKESEKSFDYEGEADQCWGKITWKPPKVFTQVTDAVSDTLSNVDVNPQTSDINIPTINPDVSLPTQNPSGINTTMQDFGSLLTEGVGEISTGMDTLFGHEKGSAYYLKRFGDKLAQAGMEASTGGGGYTDDQKGPRAVGPTGDETPDATLLTGSRKRERNMGIGFHSGLGSASKVPA